MPEAPQETNKTKQNRKKQPADGSPGPQSSANVLHWDQLVTHTLPTWRLFYFFLYTPSLHKGTQVTLWLLGEYVGPLHPHWPVGVAVYVHRPGTLGASRGRYQILFFRALLQGQQGEHWVQQGLETALRLAHSKLHGNLARHRS